MSKSALRHLFAWALCLLGSGQLLAAPIAYVDQLQGTLQVQYGARAPQALRIGGTIEPGGVLATGPGSNAVVKFEDGQLMVLQENTRFAVRKYDFVKANVSKSSALFELLRGGLRFVTGVIGATNKNAFKLTAGTATIGIRGTDGTVIYDAIADVITAAVNAGVLALQTPLGLTSIPTGAFSSSAPNAPPAAPAPIAQAAPAIAAVLARAVAVPVPINTPVVVEKSAQAAAAAEAARAAAQAAAAAPTDTAAQQAAAEARAAADTALQSAVQEATQVYLEAVQGGAVAPEAPASPTTTPSTTSSTTDTTTAETTSTAETIEALPATAAGTEQPAETIEALPATAAGTEQPAATTTTPTATGSGSGGGGTASVR